MRPDAPAPWRKTLRAEPKGISRPRTAAQYAAKAKRVMQVAVADAMDQRANGWTTPEIAVCLVDAAEIIDGLRGQAAAIIARRKPVTA